MGRVANQVLVAVALSLGACGGGDDPPARATTPPVSPPEGCQAFVDLYCDQIAECVVSTERARMFDDCEFAFQINFDCSEVQELGDNYSRCMRETRQLSCAAYDPEEGMPLPSSCQGIFVK